jgi:hypothetical protein
VKLTINIVYVLHPKHYGRRFALTGHDAWREMAIGSVWMYAYQLRELLTREGKMGNVIGREAARIEGPRAKRTCFYC